VSGALRELRLGDVWGGFWAIRADLKEQP
jgi:hypothetical protein